MSFAENIVWSWPSYRRGKVESVKWGALGSLLWFLGETERMLRGWWNEDFCNINVDSYF